MTAKTCAASISIVAITQLDAVEGKKTAKCFTGSRFAYRDNDFDNWLAKNQPNADPCVVSACAVGKAWLFMEAARALPGVAQTDNVIELGNSIIANGYAFKSLAQIEDKDNGLVARTERGEDTGLHTDSCYGNFFFVETGDPENPVSVGDVFRGGGWHSRVHRLGDAYRRFAESVLLVRNLDASKL